jgi:hypothetical protein
MNMELFDRYMKCVAALLPSAHKADILEELSDDIYSQAEEKEAELGRPLSLEEQSAILRSLGHPLQVAMRYRNIGQRQLISPLLYPAYLFALKVIFVVVCAAQIVVTTVMVLSDGNAHQIVEMFLNIPRALIPVFAWVTIAFAILDYLQAKMGWMEQWRCKWNPADLPVIRPDRLPSRPLQKIFQILMSVGFLAYLLIARHVPYLFFGPAAAMVDAGPSWHRIYWPLVAFVAVGIVIQSIALLRPVWRWFAPASEIALNLVGLVLLRLALKLPPNFVVPHGAVDMTKYVVMATIVNQSIFWSIFGISIGLAIACVVDGWKLFVKMRADVGNRQATSARPTFKML